MFSNIKETIFPPEKVTAVNINNDADKIVFTVGESNKSKTFTVTACADCCSRSSFIKIETVNTDLIVADLCSIIGHSIIRIDDLRNHQDFSKNDGEIKQINNEDEFFDDLTQFDDYAFVLDNNTTVPFRLRNDSNGYYSGYIYVGIPESSEKKPSYDTSYDISNEKGSVVIIVGLPGSGKTTYAAQKLPEHILFDDFIPSFYNGKLLKAIEDGKLVCAIDPRLCNISVFDMYYTQIQKALPKNTKISLVLFENDPTNAKLNNSSRDKVNPREGITEMIDTLTKVYDITKYKHMNHAIVSVYTEK